MVTKSVDQKETQEEQRLTLQTVRSVLTKNVFDNPTWKGLYFFFRDVIVFGLIFTALWNTNEWYYVLPLWVLSGFIISGLFIIGHDACHGALFKSEKLAYWIGQLAMLPSLHSYNQWAYGHNRIHHGHTIKWDADFVWHPMSPEDYSKLSAWGKLMHKLNWSSLGGGMYYMIEIWFKGMILHTAPIAGAKRDKFYTIFFAMAVTAATFYFGAITATGMDWAQGAWMFAKVALIPFIIWNYIIGITVYVHHINDKIQWKGRREWSPFHGQVLGTVNYHIPAIINFFFHDIFIHMPHHVHMKIPFYHLNDALQEIKKSYGAYVIERKSIIMDYFRATSNCKLYDIKQNKWISYAEVK